MDRLETIVKLARNSNSVADIGCDHGQVGVELLKSTGVTHVISTDISEKCLKKSEFLFASTGFQSEYDGRVGDGLKTLNRGEVDTVVIAGMGGDLIKDIVTYDIGKTLSFENFIIQPMTNPDVVRETFYKLGYGLEKDLIVIEGSKYYFLMKFSSLTDKKLEKDWFYTSSLLRDSIETYKEYLKFNLNKNNAIINEIKLNSSEKSDSRISELKINNEKLRTLLEEKVEYK